MAKHSAKVYFDADGNLIIKPYHLKDLAVIFDVNSQTLRRWMSKYETELGPKIGKYYSIPQVECLIRYIGLPQKLVVQMPASQKAA